MKKVVAGIFLWLAFGWVMNACSDKLEVDTEDLEDMEIVFNSSRQDKIIPLSIPVNASGWKAYSPTADLWCTFSRNDTDGTLLVTVDTNTVGEPRDSYILVTGGGKRQRINIKQDRMRSIILSQTSLNMRGAESSKTVEIKDSDLPGPYSAVVSDAYTSWLSAVIDNREVVVTAKENPSTTEAREGIIQVTGLNGVTGETVSVLLKVAQSPFGGLDYYFPLPEFSMSAIYKVMDGGKQIAQICKEYLRKPGSVLAQAIVVYPMTQQGEADLSKGYVAKIVKYCQQTDDSNADYKLPTTPIHGGSVVFDKGTNSISEYVWGTSEEAQFVYMPSDDNMGSTEIPNSVLAKLEPELLTDVRGDERNSYPMVKIGTQCWMAANLNTLYYNGNKSYAAIPTNISSDSQHWKSGMPSVSAYQFDDAASLEALTTRSKLGALYSFLAISGSDGFTTGGIVR